MNNFKKYPSYKDSENEWIGKIPSHWDSLLLYFAFKENKEKNKGLIESNILSLSYGELISKKGQENFGLIPESFDTYQVINPDYLVFRFTDLQNDQKSLRVGHAKNRGIITSAYLGLIPRDNLIHSKYFYYLFHNLDIKKYFYSFGGGVRLSLDWNTLKKNKYPLPPLPEQTAIANFLDKKTAEIKEFIALKEKTIELLKERKMAIINELVTGKIVWDGEAWTEPVEVKDSGIEWLGEIPKHWEVKKLKYIVDFVNRGSTPNYVEYSNSKVVNQATFSKGFWNESEIKYTLIKSPDDARGLLFENDILMASTGGGLLGKVGFFQKLEGNYIADSHVTIIRDTKIRIQPMFYYYLFSTLYSWIDGTLSKGSTNQIELQRELLRGSKFPFPTIEVQQTIVHHIEIKLGELDGLINQTKKEIELIKEYQQSLISEVVTGKVDVR